MYLKIRKIGGLPNNDVTVTISKTSTIKYLREIIVEKLDVPEENQLLLYKGKQLVNDHRIVDYDIQLNDVVQLLIKQNAPTEPPVETKSEDVEQEDHSPRSSSSEEAKPPEVADTPCESKYYKIGGLVDFIDCEYGSWYEAKIVGVMKRNNEGVENDGSSIESDVYFQIITEEDSIQDSFNVEFCDIRPRSRYVFKRKELNVGDVVLANYNIENPKERGHWYDFKIDKITSKHVEGTIFVGKEKAPLENCKVKFIDEIMKIESITLLEDRNDTNKDDPVQRKNAPRCNKCKDNSRRKCNECGCRICSGKEDIATIILCDECDYGYHIACLTPPLLQIPEEDEWYCPSCKTDENEIVKAGDKLKFSSKKAKRASNKEEPVNRDWGRGMACVGRTKECTIVPKDHYGPVPGVDVGTCWKFRLQASEAGIHRPHVAGIHGRETDGAYSLVLSGGYEDDIDNGEEFYYTGSGGRDLSGNKRISDQSSDQKLTRMNKALALNCNAKFNDADGAEAKDWRAGKPVRVVRNYKLAKHSKYAPKDGNRYDGIYKVVKYYPEKGKSGFLVWRYLLRRDDPAPAPWSKNGQELDMLYPPGYLEALAEKEKTNSDSSSKSVEGGKKKGVKRALSDATNTSSSNTSKKTKQAAFKLDEKLQNLIDEDQDNVSLWAECLECVDDGRQKFISKVQEIFLCICCQEVVYLPITSPCKHNMCKSCLQRSFAAKIFTCPYCRFEFGETYKLKVNEKLAQVLQFLFPGYESGR